MTLSHELLPAEEQAIRSGVRQHMPAAVELLKRLVAIPSENPKLIARESLDEARCQDVIEHELRTCGLRVDRFDALPNRPDVVGRKHGSGGGRSLVLNGHVDVVPAGDDADWTYPPFSGTVADGQVWGRGACDMKGGIVAALTAIRALDTARIELAGDLVVQSVVDEETGGPGTRAAIERGHVADAAICVEPTDLQIMPVEGGLEWVRIVVRGKAGHAALRYQSVHAGGGAPAVNAIEKMHKILDAVLSLEREWGIYKRHPLLPPGITTINPGVMLAGSGGGADGVPNVTTAVATIPDYCSLELDLKYLPNETPARIREEFEAFIARIAANDRWLAEHPPEIEWGIRGVSFPPAETAADHPLIETLSRQIAAVTSKPAKLSGFVAVSDIAWLAEAGIPCTLFGPGQAQYAHAVDERIAIDDLEQGAEILARTAASWCGIVRHDGRVEDR